MTATPWPASPAWLHEGARSGFEVVYFQPVGDGFRIEGRVVAIEDAEPWIVDYDIVVDGAFRTRAATVSSRTAQRIRSAMLTADGHGRWRIDGSSAPQLDGCLDIDLEASAFTNALPVRRLTLGDGQKAASPAAYVRATDASVVRLEQTYTRAISTEAGQRYDYQAPTFGFPANSAMTDTAWSSTIRGLPNAPVEAIAELVVRRWHHDAVVLRSDRVVVRPRGAPPPP